MLTAACIFEFFKLKFVHIASLKTAQSGSVQLIFHQDLVTHCVQTDQESSGDVLLEEEKVKTSVALQHSGDLNSLGLLKTFCPIKWQLANKLNHTSFWFSQTKCFMQMTYHEYITYSSHLISQVLYTVKPVFSGDCLFFLFGPQSWILLLADQCSLSLQDNAVV